MFGMLNVGSFILGLIAWSLPIVNLMRDRKHATQNWVGLSMISLSACGISLCFQILSIYHRVTIKDWSALLDTISAIAVISSILLIVTILLNAITLIVYRNRSVK